MAAEERSIRSLFTLVVGTAMMAIGGAATVADLTPIDGVQSGSVAVLAAGAAVLVAILASGRSDRSQPG